MRFFINIIKVVLFFGVGTALFFIPYEKYREKLQNTTIFIKKVI